MAGSNGGKGLPRMTKRWGSLPKNTRGITSFEMREIEAKDELMAAVAVEQNLPSGLRNNQTAIGEIALRERIRMALVSVNDQPVSGPVPYVELNNWPLKLYNAAKRAFLELNVMSDDEGQAFEKGGKVIERHLAEDPGDTTAPSSS